MNDKILTNICYVFGGIGFILAAWALIGVFEPVEPTDLTPVGHMIGFIGFLLFGITMLQMALSFKNLETLAMAVV